MFLCVHLKSWRLVKEINTWSQLQSLCCLYLAESCSLLKYFCIEWRTFAIVWVIYNHFLGIFYSARHLQDPKIRIETLKKIKEFSIWKLCFMFLSVCWGSPCNFQEKTNKLKTSASKENFKKEQKPFFGPFRWPALYISSKEDFLWKMFLKILFIVWEILILQFHMTKWSAP